MTPQQEKLLQDVQALLVNFNRTDRYTIQKLLQVLDGNDIQLGRKTGTRIGTSISQKLGFFGKTPVVQQAAISPPSGGLVIDAESRTAIASLLTELHNLGLIA